MTCSTGKDVALAARLLKSGGLVAIPTETVYGLGANALDEITVARLFEAKNRPRFDPLIVHLPSADQLDRFTHSQPETVKLLAKRFWPGPLTLVLPKRSLIPDLVTSGLESVAIRVPDHPLTQALLCEADLPIAAPSANLFGCLSPTSAPHVADQLGNRIDYILDGGPCRVGVESTVLQVCASESGEPAKAVLFRPGGITVEELEEVIGPISIPEPIAYDDDDSNHQAPSAPGMLSRHYAPSTQLVIFEKLPQPKTGERVGLLTLQPCDTAASFTAVETLSETGNLVEAAAAFFAALRRLDAHHLDRIVACPFPQTGLGRALNDRLKRASHPGD